MGGGGGGGGGGTALPWSTWLVKPSMLFDGGDDEDIFGECSSVGDPFEPFTITVASWLSEAFGMPLISVLDDGDGS